MKKKRRENRSRWNSSYFKIEYDLNKLSLMGIIAEFLKSCNLSDHLVESQQFNLILSES